MTYAKYVWIWVWLAGLMLLGVLASSLPVAHRAIVAIVLALSTVKALLVALYYMRLRFDARFLAWVAMLPIPFGVILAVIVLLDKPLLR